MANELIYLVTKYYDVPADEYHLAVDVRGTIHTACGSVMMPSLCDDPGIELSKEPSGKACCKRCGYKPLTKAFRWKFFDGALLKFTRQKTKRMKKTKETEEYRYEDEYYMTGLFAGHQF